MAFFRGADWEQVKKRILERDKICVHTGKKPNAVHHITPWELTQDNQETNLIALSSKGHGHEHNYMKRLLKPSPAVRIRMEGLYPGWKASRGL